jgi:hypothetical protein
VEMVEADSKTPFKEHRRKSDGKMFAEVEPDIEYFVRIQKVGENHGHTNNQYEYKGVQHLYRPRSQLTDNAWVLGIRGAEMLVTLCTQDCGSARTGSPLQQH